MTEPTVSKNATVALKPCPFCGGEPDNWWWRGAIACPECGFQMNE